MKIRGLLFLIAISLSLSVVSAQGIGTYTNCEIYGNCAPVGSWITPSLGILTDANETQFFSNDGVLNILESWLNEGWLRLDGANSPLADISWGGFNIDNLGNITLMDRILFGDANHLIRKGALGFNGLASDAIAIQHLEVHDEGTVPFIVTSNRSGNGNDAVVLLTQVGRNNSAGYLGNSWMVAPNNLTNNLTELSNCLYVINQTGTTPRILCDTSGSGADFFVQDDIQLGGTLFSEMGIRVVEIAEFFMEGNDVNIQNGSIHLLNPTTFQTGVNQGEEIIPFQEFFISGLGSFTNLQIDPGNWVTTTSVSCAEGDCAVAEGSSGAGDIIMQTNVSTSNMNGTSLNFVYSLINMVAASNFSVTVNNNSGSGEVVVFSDSTLNVDRSSQIVSLPESMSNISTLSINFNCDVTNPNRQCFVDNVRVNGSAIDSILNNQSGFNSVIKFGAGDLASDGFPEKGIIYNASTESTIFRGKTSSETRIIDTSNDGDSIDVSSVNIIFTNTSAGDITITGFTGGSLGQVLHIVNTDTTNDVLVQHDSSVDQDIFLNAGGTDTLNNAYGGWILVFDGTDWYESAHAI